MKMVNRISFDLNIPNLAKKIAEVEKEIINLQIKICAVHCTNPSEPNEKKKMMMETDKQLIKMLRAIMTLITPTWDTNRYQVEKAKGILRSNNLDDLVTECKKVRAEETKLAKCFALELSEEIDGSHIEDDDLPF